MKYLNARIDLSGLSGVFRASGWNHFPTVFVVNFFDGFASGGPQTGDYSVTFPAISVCTPIIKKWPFSGRAMVEITALLVSARAGDKHAASQVFNLLYADLHRLAKSRLRQHQTFTLLDATSLVHESYLRLVGTSAAPFDDRKHFFTYAATVMRSVIVDYVRARAAQRRGGGQVHLALTTGMDANACLEGDYVTKVHEALEVLAQAEPALAKVVEMRYFGGMTESEIAEVLGLSERTIRRQWEKAKLLLAAVLS